MVGVLRRRGRDTTDGYTEREGALTENMVVCKPRRAASGEPNLPASRTVRK